MSAPLRGSRVLGAAVGLGVAAVAVVGCGLICVGLREPVSFAYWDHLAASDPSPAELQKLERCDSEPHWWTWVQVLAKDLDVPCGEDWATERIARKVGGTRGRWLAQRAGDPEAPIGLRVRAAVILALAGQPSPVEAALLLPSLPDNRRSAWVWATSSPAVAAQVGAGGRALGVAARLADGAAPLDDPALGALAFLAAVDDPMAESAVRTVALRLLDADPAVVAQVAERRERGRAPPPGVPRAWISALLAHRDCEPRCGALWLELLRDEQTRRALDQALETPRDPDEDPALAEWLALTGASADTHRALGWAVGALAEWVLAAPEPAERLRSLAAEPARGAPDPVAFAWHGGATPFVGALVVAAVADRAGLSVELRARPGEVWLRTGAEDWAVRGCGSVGAEPPAEPWPRASLRAAALLERAAVEADPTRALRLATAARRLDPLIGGPTAERLGEAAPPELEAGRRIGAALLGAVRSPSGAEVDRGAVGSAPIECP